MVWISTHVAAAQPLLRVSDASVVEGNSGYVEAVFRVELDQPSAGWVTAVWNTFGVTATPTTAEGPGDFAIAAGSVDIPPGQTRTEIRVAILSDVKPEPDETFEVRLSGLSGALPGRITAIGTIRDDDGGVEPAPTLKIEKASGNAVRLSWKGDPAKWILRTSGSPTSGPWSEVGGPFTVEAGEAIRLVPVVGSGAFFQLKSLP